MLVSILILATIRSARTTANQQTQQAVFVAALSMLVVCGTSGNGTPSNRARGDSPGYTDPSLSLFDRDRAGVASVDSSEHKQLREGTLVPPTTGRMVMLGRRWAFVVSEDDQPTTDDPYLLDRQAGTIGTQSAPTNRPRPLGNARSLGSPQPLGRLGEFPQSNQLNSQFDRRQQKASLSTPDKSRRMIVSENLMLQRIVEAIRADGSDDRWMISGQVTEFFNENRLTIRTAQRAIDN